MGPKVEALIEYFKATDHRGIICNLEDIEKAKGLVEPGGAVDTTEPQAEDLPSFYALSACPRESGGQQGDCGMVITPSGKFAVINTERIANCVIHHGKVTSGSVPA